MDRRLPVKPGPFFGQLARRELVLEQRLDQLATMRKRSQRYLNPPCCGSGSLSTLEIEAATVVLGTSSAFTFSEPATALTIELSGTAPADDGRGFGLEIEVDINGVLATTLTLTGAGTTGALTFTQWLYPTDTISFEVTDKSTGTASAITILVRFSGTTDTETEVWVDPV